MTDIVKRFGEKLRDLRKSKKLSQEALSKKAGLDRTYVGKIERGEKSPSLHTIEKLANILDVEVSEFFEY